MVIHINNQPYKIDERWEIKSGDDVIVTLMGTYGPYMDKCVLCRVRNANKGFVELFDTTPDGSKAAFTKDATIEKIIEYRGRVGIDPAFCLGKAVEVVPVKIPGEIFINESYVVRKMPRKDMYFAQLLSSEQRFFSVTAEDAVRMMFEALCKRHINNLTKRK